MIKNLLVLPVALTFCNLRAQTIKTDVLVIGNGPSAVAAAIQSARSKVKTVLAIEKIGIDGSEEKLTIEENLNVPSGIWGEFRNNVKEINKTQAGFDTAFNKPLNLTRAEGEGILRKIADTVKKLTIEWNTTFTSIQKSGDEWEIKVSKDGKAEEIKAKIVVDATETGEVAKKAGAKATAKMNIGQISGGSDLFRTAIAASETWPPVRPAENTDHEYWYVPLKAMVPPGADNLLVTQTILPLERDANYLPVELELGQGAGAAAAYCAFFKTTTAHLKVRTIQGELLDFKADLVPFVDVPPTDPYWRQIQQIALTGLLTPGTAFGGDMPVTTAEIKPGLIEIYSRAFLWFEKEKPGKAFTIANMLSYISDYSLTEPSILKATIQKAWKSQLKFTSDFEPGRPITRREFAVLANKYLNPFARTLDLNGKLVN